MVTISSNKMKLELMQNRRTSEWYPNSSACMKHQFNSGILVANAAHIRGPPIKNSNFKHQECEIDRIVSENFKNIRGHQVW